MKYILDDNGKVVPEPDTMKWAVWFENADNRRLAITKIGETKVSTVFLGLDHGWGDGPPVLWETMVFGGPLDQHQDRCAGNKEQAEAMHGQWVAKVKAAQEAEEFIA